MVHTRSPMSEVAEAGAPPLHAVIAAHHTVLDRQPPDRGHQLADARSALTVASDRPGAAEDAVAATTAQLERLRTLAGLTRTSRATRDDLQTTLHTRRGHRCRWHRRRR
jgi:hypothetical protein